MKQLLTSAIIAGLLAVPAGFGQRFYPDDPIAVDPDRLDIPKPAYLERTPLVDLIENTILAESAVVPAEAENANTLGEVPDSSWFTNRVGLWDAETLETAIAGCELRRPDFSGTVRIVGAELGPLTEGLVLRTDDGSEWFVMLDRKGYPKLASGAQVVSSRLLHALGYNAVPASPVQIDPGRLQLDPSARILMLGGTFEPLARQYLEEFWPEHHRDPDGTYPGAASPRPGGQSVGQFCFAGTRPDDANDVIVHENRRELRGLRVFAAWLNHYLCRQVNTRDYYVTEGGRSFLRHYLVDFSSSLGSGYDLKGQIVPKPKRAGYQYSTWSGVGDTLKTALSLGLWERPWMRVEYPYPRFGEIGRIEADFYAPGIWKPDYPNPAFRRMLADDAFWAASLLARITDRAIQMAVEAAGYRDPEAARYLAETLVRRRDKTVRYYLRELNPLGRFSIEEGMLGFRNLGVDWGLAPAATYQGEWFTFDNGTGRLAPLAAASIGRLDEGAGGKVAVPEAAGAEFLMLRLKTEAPGIPEWSRPVDVYLRLGQSPEIAGIDRDIPELE